MSMSYPEELAALAQKFSPTGFWLWFTKYDSTYKEIVKRAMLNSTEPALSQKEGNACIEAVAFEIARWRFAGEHQFEQAATLFKNYPENIPRSVIENLCSLDMGVKNFPNKRILFSMLWEKIQNGQVGEGILSRFFFNIFYKKKYIEQIQAVLAGCPSQEEAIEIKAIDSFSESSDPNTDSAKLAGQLSLYLTAHFVAASVIMSDGVEAKLALPAAAATAAASLLSFVPVVGGLLAGAVSGLIMEVNAQIQKEESEKFIKGLGFHVNEKIQYFSTHMAEILKLELHHEVNDEEIKELAKDVTARLRDQLIERNAEVKPEEWFILALETGNLTEQLVLEKIEKFFPDAKKNEAYYEKLESQYQVQIQAINSDLTRVFHHLRELNYRLLKVEWESHQEKEKQLIIKILKDICGGNPEHVPILDLFFTSDPFPAMQALLLNSGAIARKYFEAYHNLTDKSPDILEKLKLIVPLDLLSSVQFASILENACNFLELVQIRNNLNATEAKLSSIRNYNMDIVIRAVKEKIKEIDVTIATFNILESKKEYVSENNLSSDAIEILLKNIDILERNKQTVVTLRQRSVVVENDLLGSFQLPNGGSIPVYEQVRVDPQKKYTSLDELSADLEKQNQELKNIRLDNGRGTSVELEDLNLWLGPSLLAPSFANLATQGLFSEQSSSNPASPTSSSPNV